MIKIKGKLPNNKMQYVHAIDDKINQNRIFKSLADGDTIKTTSIFVDQYGRTHSNFTKDNKRCDYLLKVKKNGKKQVLYITYKNNDYVLMK